MGTKSKKRGPNFGIGLVSKAIGLFGTLMLSHYGEGTAL